MVEVWHVRHGERADEISGPEKARFKASTAYQEDRSYDPPLTRHGHVQASRAGRFLGRLPFNQPAERKVSGFDRVYCSPLLRAVQTAFCISHQLGGIPLQVVPGLGSCTAAMVRIGYDNATVMSDTDLRDAFPGVNLLPRDVTAPTSFDGACAWLAARTTRTRVLAVGHREGTKAMAGRRVPTPHCCIGIFNAAQVAGRPSYQMQELLSHKGIYLSTSSSYLVEEKIGTQAEHSSDVGLLDGLVVQGREQRPDAFLTGDRWLRRSLRGSRKSKDEGRDVAPEPKRISYRLKPATRREVEATSTVKKEKTTGPSMLLRYLRKTRGGKGKAKDILSTDGAVDRKAEQRTGVTSERSKAKANKKLPPATIGSKSRSVDDIPPAIAQSKSKKEAAGSGFRAATLARASSSRASKVAAPNTLVGTAPDLLSGPMGALSFLHPRDLCVSQFTCKTLAAAAANDSLWRNIYARLPQKLRHHAEWAAAGVDTEAAEKIPFQDLFVTAVEITVECRCKEAKRKVKRVRRRLGAIHGLHPAVTTLKTGVTVRLNGELISVVDSLGNKSEGWVSSSNVLSEPSTRSGMRSFFLSNSIKLHVPPAMTVSRLSSMRVASASGKSWLAGATLFRILRGTLPLLSASNVRRLTRSRDDSFVLYELTSNANDCVSTKIRGTKKRDEDVVETRAPLPRGCALLGVLNDQPAGENSVKSGDGDPGIGFISVHLPHKLFLDAATRLPDANKSRRRSRTYGDDSAGALQGLESFSLALGLRTTGVPVWETAAINVTGRLCPIRQKRQGQQQSTPTCQDHHSNTSGNSSQHPSELNKRNDRTVVCIELVGAGKAKRNGGLGRAPAAGPSSGGSTTLSAGPRLPFSTSGGLSGVFEDVLLADFALCDEHGDSLWAFTSPIVFDGVANGRGKALSQSDLASGDRIDEDDVIDMTHAEERGKRRRGMFEEPGVGRVSVELAQVDPDGSSGQDTRQHRQQSPRGTEAGGDVTWIVRVARVELELGFINSWFGTNYGL